MAKIYTTVYVEGYRWQMKKFCQVTFGPSGPIKGNPYPWKRFSNRCWGFKDSLHATMFALRWSGKINDEV